MCYVNYTKHRCVICVAAPDGAPQARTITTPMHYVFCVMWTTPSTDVLYVWPRPTEHHMHRVGQSHAYTVYIRHFWQENHHIYGHIRRLYTVYGPGQPYTCTNHKNAGHKGSEFCRSTNRRPMLTDSLLFIKALMHVPFKLQGFTKS
jgi:hypothetical protein